MSNEEMNQRVAGLLGFQKFKSLNPDFEWGWKHANGEYHYALPNYCNDLNAAHEMEKSLTHIECIEYHNDLHSAQADDVYEADGETAYPAVEYWFHATAEQRVRAFLAVKETSPHGLRGGE